MKKKYFVTGGAGFIGSNVVDCLLKQNHTVYTIDDLSTGTLTNLSWANKQPGHHFFEQSVMDFDWDAHLSPGDHVLHLAAAVGVDYVTKSALFTSGNNLGPTQLILDKCRQHSCSLLFTSTSEVYGNHDRNFSCEEDALNLYVHHGGRSAYTLSKLFGEFLCLEYAREYNMQVTVLRLFNTIGDRQSHHFGMVVPTFIHKALKNEPLVVFGEGDQTRSFCDVEDTAKAICLLSSDTTRKGEIYNVGNNVSVTILELANYIRTITNSQSEIRIVPHPPSREGDKDIKHRKPNLDKMAEHFQWKPEVSWQDAVLKIAASIKENTVVNAY